MRRSQIVDLLLGDRLAPITSEVGFLEAERTTTVEAWLAWTRPIYAAQGISLAARQVQGDLEALLGLLPPLTAGAITRNLFVPTASPWTALFNNARGGTDITSDVTVLAGQLRCRGLRVAAVPNTIKETVIPQRGRYGAAVLEVYGPNVNVMRALPPSPREGEVIATVGKLARAIVAMNDGGRWRFDLEGDPLPFEQPERYAARRVKDRFTVPLLRDYLAALGVRAFEAEFYAPDRAATLVELEGAPVLGEDTLAEARAHF